MGSVFSIKEILDNFFETLFRPYELVPFLFLQIRPSKLCSASFSWAELQQQTDKTRVVLPARRFAGYLAL